MTKDEQYVLKLYELAKGSKGYKNCYEVGEALRFSPKVTLVIVNTLAQANFIKKKEGALIHLTERGIKLAQDLLLL